MNIMTIEGGIIPGRMKSRADFTFSFSFRDGLFRRHLEITKNQECDRKHSPAQGIQDENTYKQSNIINCIQQSRRGDNSSGVALLCIFTLTYTTQVALWR